MVISTAEHKKLKLKCLRSRGKGKSNEKQDGLHQRSSERGLWHLKREGIELKIQILVKNVYKVQLDTQTPFPASQSEVMMPFHCGCRREINWGNRGLHVLDLG